MPPISDEAFAAAVRDLNGEEFTAFVADIWRGRGFAVEFEDRTTLSVSKDELERRLSVEPAGAPWYRGGAAPDPLDDPGVDAIVTARSRSPDHPPRGDGRELIDVTELRAMALYALPLDRRREVFETHLGRPPTRPASDVEGGPSWRGVGVNPASAVAVVAALLLGSLGVAGMGPFPAGEGVATTPEGPAQPLGAKAEAGPGGGATVNGTARPGLTSEATPTPSPPSDTPPGFGPDGSLDATTLAATHAGLIENQSYTWTITFRRKIAGRGITILRETIRVLGPGRYVTEYRAQSKYVGKSPVISELDAYGDGSRRYVRVGSPDNETVRASRIDPEGRNRSRYTVRFERYLRWLLDVERAEVTGRVFQDGRWQYRLAGIGNRRSGIREFTVAALVDDRGLVTQLRATYRPEDRSKTIYIITFRLDDLGETTIERPEWVQDALNASVTSGSLTK